MEEAKSGEGFVVGALYCGRLWFQRVVSWVACCYRGALRFNVSDWVQQRLVEWCLQMSTIFE